jgi:serine protease Do
MKKVMLKKMIVAGVALLAFPSLLLAQGQEDKAKKEKEAKEMQTIVITRNQDATGKTIIEIDGDKVKVNGKDAKDNKDVDVHVTRVKTGANTRVFYNNGQGRNAWSMDVNDEHISFFDEDSNRAMLGVTTEGTSRGAEVKSVVEGSAADKAGIRKGDVITRIGNRKIESSDDVTEMIRERKPGDKVDVSYLREGKETKASAELGKWKGIRMTPMRFSRVAPAHPGEPAFPSIQGNPYEDLGARFSQMGRPRLGMSIQETEDGKGVKVLEVESDGNAAKAGLKKDDVILSIDDKEIKGTDDLTRAIRSTRDKFSYNLKIQRDGKTQNLEVKLPRKLKTADL